MASLALFPFRPLFSPNTFLNSSARTSNRNNSRPPRVHLRPIYCIRAINGQVESTSVSTQDEELQKQRRVTKATNPLMHAIPCSSVISWLSFVETARSSEITKLNMMYQTSEFFELGIQLSYVVTLLALLGAGTFFVIRQVLVRRELDLSAKDLQEQVRSGDASGTEYFELGAVMLRRKFYPAAIKYLKEAISKWDRDDQDLAQVYNALGVSYARDNNLEKGIKNLEMAVKLQPGYVTAWNNLGDAYEKKKDMKAALRAFEEALLFDPNNKVARPRAETLRDKVRMYRGVEVRSKER